MPIQTALGWLLEVQSAVAQFWLNHCQVCLVPNQQLSQLLLIFWCNCFNSHRILHMSTLLVYSSTKNINMLFRSLCTWSSFLTSFRASSYTISCIVMSASCCVNVVHFFLSLLCIPYNCSSLLLNTSISFFKCNFPKPIHLVPTLISCDPYWIQILSL